MLPGLSSFVLRQRRQTDWLCILQDILLLVKFAAKLTLFFNMTPYIPCRSLPFTGILFVFTIFNNSFCDILAFKYSIYV